MDPKKIKSALKDITAEKDPTIKSVKLASLCTSLWAERGVKLVVVGGSAIEILTEGAYASGDIDFCHASKANLPVRERQEVMGLLGAKGGPRNWQVGGMFVDILGPLETFARTGFRHIDAPYGQVLLVAPEELLVERVLVSVYPEKDQDAEDCAKKFIAAVLDGYIAMDWNEVCRIANLPEYRNLSEVEKIVGEVADERKIKNPLHPD
ncbi:MAG TPA: hypothetical protein VFB72_15350 [Verrucomicrobiae bacterium]|nr:hypothetical protein [Verrucomicrobiae bacterium]